MDHLLHTVESTQKPPRVSRRLPWPVALVMVFILAVIAAAADKHAAPAGAAPAPPPPPAKESPKPTVATATKEAPFVNTLGMKFVPVPGTKALFSVWETRVQDYQAFVDAKKLTWEKPGFIQGPTHPAVMVSYEDAAAFCQWLTEKEGLGTQGLAYRLPTDAEWSVAVGLVGEIGGTPREKWKVGSEKIYPWGTAWPAPAGAGNFGDNDDGFFYTSPAGRFTPNAFGLYDLSGNVWEWCADWYDSAQKGRVLRGGSWGDTIPKAMLSSYRWVDAPNARDVETGFRCVLGAVGGASAPTPATQGAAKEQTPPAPKPAAATATKEAPFVNTLGMKFVPVPGTKVLFSVWETRVQDYQAFVDVKKVRWDKPDFAQGPTHPAVMVSDEDAVAFCRWLTEKEGLAARGLVYRLPTDAEWSAAVGLASETGATPEEKERNGSKDVYPWGAAWPPPPGAGNFADATANKVAYYTFINGYDDGFAYTSPAGQFSPNAFGLYDLSGNVCEWCADWANRFERVMRGADFRTDERLHLRSARRESNSPGSYGDHVGFRCVVAPVDGAPAP